ncbi:Adenine deaminase [Venturia inaequalis]|nr:Adenine deaminase [Venturia inaequalis]
MPPHTRSKARLAACFPFMKLPRELRDMVYNYSLSYDGIQEVMISKTYRKLLPSPLLPAANEKSLLQTPAILLLDKQTSSEAVECLRKKELIFTSPVPCGPSLRLDYIIPRRAFNNIRRIRLAMPETQKISIYCECSEHEYDEEEEEEEEEEKGEVDIDPTLCPPLWVNLLENLFRQFGGSASDSCMVEQLWLQVGAEVLVFQREMIFLLATEAVTIVDEAYKNDPDEPDCSEIIEAILEKARSFDEQK